MRKLIVIVVLLSIASLLLWADTATETWADAEWNDWTGATITNNCDQSSTFQYEATNGNPTHNWYAYCEGRSDELEVYIYLQAITWEDLGVTASNVVSSVQMTDADTNCTDYATCSIAEIGPFELRDSSNTLVSTLWSGRVATSDEDTWTAEGSQSAQGCGSICASSASIEFWLHWGLGTGNDMNANCGIRLDNLDISIEHATPVASGRHKFWVSKVRFGVNDEGKMVVVSSITEPAPAG